MVTAWLLALSVTGAEPAEWHPGEIHGIVVNTSRGRAACTNTEVLLRVRQEGQFVPVEQTVTDAQGRFRFADLPLGRKYLYLPGANHGDVHYPGPRLQLTGADPSADVTLEVCDIVHSPCPLVIKQQQVLLRPEPGILHVEESIRVSNPSGLTYVGQAEQAGTPAVTLRLSIPREFERTTFYQEFYGRQFSIADSQLVTSIPWTPGERELKFRYTIRNDQRCRVWQRPLDLPCENLYVRVVHDNPDEIACNLDPSAYTARGEKAFSSRGELLPAGHVIRVELGKLPVPWTTYARWSALVVLLGLVIGTAVVLVGRRRAPRPSAPPAIPEPVPDTHSSSAERLRDSHRQRRRRRAA